MNRLIKIHVALVLVSIAAAVQAGAQTRTVTRAVLNMYSSATTDADVVSQAIYAMRVTVVEERNGWSKIRTPDDYSGWVESAGLLAASPSSSVSDKNVVVVRSLFAHVYRETSVTKHAPLITVPFETRFPVVADVEPVDGWIAVRLADGRVGAVQGGDVAPVTATPLTIDETIALGKRFLGLPYTWGGTSSYGYDCSGFMQMLMRQRGYLMPRDASVQARWDRLVPVDTKDLRPGDLLYFGSSADHITHTGMYIGGGQFIDSTTYQTPMVRIDNLSEPHWTKLLVAARRVKP